MSNIPSLDYRLIDRLSRGVNVSRKGVLMSTETLPGIKYAFYLRGEELLRKGYIERGSFFFDFSPDPGVYKATYFYKLGDEKYSVSNRFYLDEFYKAYDLEGTVVDEEDGWRIDNYDIGSKVTFLVFNSTGSTKKTKPFGFEYLIKNKFNIVHCLQEKNQYQSLSFEKLKQVVSPLLVGKKVFLYGSSLGGYCALYYAGAVNGTAIAAAPRNSAHPNFINRAQGKSRYKIGDFYHKDIAENPASSFNPYIFYDPYVENDKYFINSQVRKAYPGFHEVCCDFAGHPVLMHLNHTKQLSDIIKKIVCGKSVLVDCSKESCYTDLGRAKQAIRENDFNTARFYLEKLIDSPKFDAKVSEKAKLLYSEFFAT